MTAAEFRAAFRAFAEPAAASDAAVDGALALAAAFVNPERWGAVADRGIGLYAAHVLTMDARRAAPGGGGAAGVLVAKALGGASASYDTGATTISGAGDLNATSYGQEFARLSRLFGAGVIQL